MVKNLLAFFVVVFIIGCSSSHVELVEVVSQEEQTIAELNQTPTTFDLEVDDDYAVWGRVRLFFRQYLPDETLSTDEDQYITNIGSSGKYIYQIRRTFVGSKSHYVVRCISNNGDPQLAERNAKNLARFMRSGTLELNLLAK